MKHVRSWGSFFGRGFSIPGFQLAALAALGVLAPLPALLGQAPLITQVGPQRYYQFTSSQPNLLELQDFFPGPNVGLSPGGRAQIEGTNFGWSDFHSPPTAKVEVGGRAAVVLHQDVAFTPDTSALIVQLPLNAPLGETTIVVIAEGGARSEPFPVRIDPYSPVLLPDNLPFNCRSNAFAPVGSRHKVYALGLGATNPPVPRGQQSPDPPVPTVDLPIITVGGQRVRVFRSVLIPGFIGGPYELEFEIPPGNGVHELVINMRGYKSEPQTLTVGPGIQNVMPTHWTGRSLGAPEAYMVAYGCGVQLGHPGWGGIEFGQTGDPINPPTSLAGATLTVRDSAGVERLAPLFYTNYIQVQYQIPAGTAPGQATITSTSASGIVVTGRLEIKPVSPGIFMHFVDNLPYLPGVVWIPVGYVVRVRDGQQTWEPLFNWLPDQTGKTLAPIDLGPETDQVWLVLSGSGLRHRSSLENASLKIGGISVPVSYMGAQGQYAAIDQVNVLLPRTLAGHGAVDLELTVDGEPANTTQSPGEGLKVLQLVFK